MSSEKSFYVVLEPNRTIYVDTDDQGVALKVAVRVRYLMGEIRGVGFSPTPTIERQMIDPNLLKDPQEYEGVKYWLAP